MNHRKDNNPEGHNQYTKDRKENESVSRGSQKGSQKQQPHNPEGHNQYTKKD